MSGIPKAGSQGPVTRDHPPVEITADDLKKTYMGMDTKSQKKVIALFADSINKLQRNPVGVKSSDQLKELFENVKKVAGHKKGKLSPSLLRIWGGGV